MVGYIDIYRRLVVIRILQALHVYTVLLRIRFELYVSTWIGCDGKKMFKIF